MAENPCLQPSWSLWLKRSDFSHWECQVFQTSLPLHMVTLCLKWPFFLVRSWTICSFKEIPVQKRPLFNISFSSPRPCQLFFLVRSIVYPSTHQALLIRSDYTQLIFVTSSSYILWGYYKHWTSRSWAIVPSGDTRFGSYEPLVTIFSSTDQYITLFYVYLSKYALFDIYF